MQQKNSKKALIIGIVAAILALAGVLVVLLAGIPAWTAQAPTTTVTETTAPVFAGPLEVYWNLDQALYDGKSEAGMSSRMPESDGYFHVRLFKDGKVVELKAADRRVINHLDTLTIMGLQFDENGVIVGVFEVEDLPMEKMGWQFYVQSIGGKLLKVNSSNKMNGLEVLLELGDSTAIYDMTGAEGEVGTVVEPIPGDRVYPIVDLEGNVLCVFIYKRDNYMQEVEGDCIHCGKAVTWKQWVKTDAMPVETGHYQLQNDIQLKAQASLGEDCKMCLDLNGKVINGRDGQRAVSMHNAGVELAVMDTSEGQKGAIRSHGQLAGQGGVMYVRFGAFYLYSGTLDGSDAVNTYAGAVMCINKGAFAYINGGTVKGGTAKYSLDAKGKPGNGMGGNIRILGKLVINDGLITDGKALAHSTRKNGKTTYSRGYGGNIYMGTGGVLEMKGGKVANGVAGGMGGNIYIDGDCEMTMTGGVIGNGKLTTADRNGGNLFVGSKSTFKMSGGYIRNGRVYNGGGNVYANGKVTISGGQIYGGKVIDKATGAEKNAVHNNLYVVNGDLRITGGTIKGGVTVTDSSTTDKSVAKLSISGSAVIYGAAKGRSNLTLSSSGEKVLINVGKLSKNAKIGISTTRGVFTQPRDEKEMEHFISDIPGAEVVYYDGAYALGKVGCLCGKQTHAGSCDGAQRLWCPWTTATKLPTTTGNYYLTAAVEATAQSTVAADQKVVLDLNGQSVTGSANRIYSVAAAGAALTVTDTKGGGVLKNSGAEGDLGGIVLVRTGAKLTLLGGTLDASEFTCVNTNGGAAVFVNTGAAFDMAGGTVKGGKVTAGNGGAIAIAKDGTMTLTGGTVEGGDAGTGKGGNIYAMGALTVTGGTVKGGKAQYGGNIYTENKLTLSGGTVTGGSGSTANIHVVNGELLLSGGKVNGGVMVDDRAKDDGIQTVLRISGKPEVTGAKSNLTLATRGDGVLVYVEKMEKGASVGITGEVGTFSQPCDKGSEKYFTSDKETVDVVWYDGALALGKAGCVCGKEDHLPGCDKKVRFWKPWTADSLPTTSGYWYLVKKLTLKKTAAIPADQAVVLDLNNQQVTVENSRAYSVDQAGASLVITDRSKDGKGTIRITGESEASGLCIYVRNGNATLFGGILDASAAKTTHADQGGIALWINKDRTFTMNGGTVKGGTTTCMNGGAIEVSAGGTMELHGGTVVGSAMPDAKLNGTAINISGTLKMSGGTVKGGTTAGVGGSICVKGTMEMTGGKVTGGTTTGNGGNIYITESGKMTMKGGTVEKGSAKYGVNFFVDGKLTMSGGKVLEGNILVIDGEMTLSGGQIDTLSVDDRTVGDSIKTLVTLSGDPKVGTLKLENRGDACKLKVGKLSDGVKLSVTAPAGLFASVADGVEPDTAAAHFTSGNTALKVSRQADGLHMVDANAVYHCLCGQKPHLAGCDGNEHLWKKWAKTNAGLPAETGYWYLEDSMTLTATVSLAADQKVVLDLNGKTATRDSNRIYSVHNTGASLVITDSTKKGEGTLKITGTSSNAGLAIYVRNGDATLIRGNLDAGGATSTNKTGGSAIWINENRTFIMYGGTVIGGSNTHASASGGAICVGKAGATMELRGGTVKGGSVTATGKGQCLYVISGATLKMSGGKVEGELYADGALKLSGKVTVKSLTAVDKDLFTVGELKEGSSIGITGTGVVAKNVMTDVSAYFYAPESGKQAVYNAEEKTLNMQ